MSACAQCGANIATGQTICDACGMPVAQEDNAIRQHEIAKLLSEATLLRTWGQHDEAINTCTRVLTIDPTNAPAHSLLGDLYRDQGKFQEALGWYKIAVQLNPHSEHDRRRLDEMIDHVFQGALAAETTINGKPAVPKPPQEGKRKGPKGLAGFLARLQPVHVVIGCTILAVAVMLPIALFTAPHASSRTRIPARPRQSARNTALDPLATGSAANTQMQVTPPPADPIESGSGTRTLPGIVQLPGDDNNSGPNSSNTVPPSSNTNDLPPRAAEVPPYQPPMTTPPANGSVDQQTTLMKSAMERAVRDAKMSFTVDKTTVDPRTGNVSVEYTVPNVGGASQTKQALLYAGFNIAWAANKASNVPIVVNLRGYANPDNGRTATIALVADVTTQQAESAKAVSSYAAVQAYLTNPWWHPELAGAPL